MFVATTWLFSSFNVYVTVSIPESASVAFAFTVTLFVVTVTVSAITGFVLSTSNVCVLLAVFVPSVVDVVIVYSPVVKFGTVMWYVLSVGSIVTSVPNIYVVVVPFGSVTDTVVVPVVAGSTVSTTVLLFIIPDEGVTSSPVAVSL